MDHVGKTPVQHQGLLKRTLADAGYEVKPWNRRHRSTRQWLTRLYLKFKGREVGRVDVDVGGIFVQSNDAEQSPLIRRLVASHVEEHGQPVGVRRG